jgi:hypothetical protein
MDMDVVCTETVSTTKVNGLMTYVVAKVVMFTQSYLNTLVTLGTTKSMDTVFIRWQMTAKHTWATFKLVSSTGSAQLDSTEMFMKAILKKGKNTDLSEKRSQTGKNAGAFLKMINVMENSGANSLMDLGTARNGKTAKK